MAVLIIANSLQFYLVLICVVFVVTSFIDKGILYALAGTTTGFNEFCQGDNCQRSPPIVKDIENIADSVKRKYVFIPFLAIGLLVLIAFLFISSFCFNGRNFFALFTIFIVNITDLLVGTSFVIGGVLLLTYSAAQTFDGSDIFRTAFIAVTAMGGIMVFGGFMGCSAACVDKSRGCFVMYIGVAVLLALTFSAAIIASAIKGNAIIDALLQLPEVENTLVSPFSAVKLFADDQRTVYVRGLLSGVLQIAFALGISFMCFTLISVFAGCVKGCSYGGDVQEEKDTRSRKLRYANYNDEEDGEDESGEYSENDERASSLRRGLLDAPSLNTPFGGQYDGSYWNSGGGGGGGGRSQRRRRTRPAVRSMDDVVY